ncbi:MAG: hypothetical protein Q4G33_01320 [bacterium]|nr:hypothetical protein [bacterium]
MSDLTKKAVYLKGLKDGMSGELTSENINRLLDSLIDINEKLSEKVEELEERIKILELFDSEKLGNDKVGFSYDEDDDEDEDFDDFEDEDYDDGESDLFDIQCTECGEDFTVEYDEIMSDDAIRCPHCGARIELAIDFDDDEGISF